MQIGMQADTFPKRWIITQYLRASLSDKPSLHLAVVKALNFYSENIHISQKFMFNGVITEK
jgi:hypothetical protein